MRHEDMAAMIDLVKEDLSYYPLDDVAITISTRKSYRTMGTTWVHSNRITFYPSAIDSLDLAEDNVRHEFAHIITYKKYGTTGHGPDWKRTARELGARPYATIDNLALADHLINTDRKSWT